ncbi:hypothetical protein DNI29_04005 [Hymenobacter sediminis]|uniref:hypothetical protein n=1 Tax=Hymenobacter sediminis TaxID=2218621 RepID=UPI000F50C9C0|nr:hypothetical protein [Hymenobacter sediminis]RPD49966.1 hypothetical protein DNI29_04005 [Hymenobacter sediminis]
MSDDACTITSRPDLGILVARWNADAPPAQLRADYQAVLATAKQNQLGRWLLDVRRRNNLDPEIGQWTTHEFYPEAATKLAPTPLRMAILCSPARLEVYKATPEQEQYLTFGLAPERPYQMHLFIEEGPAMQWLLE